MKLYYIGNITKFKFTPNVVLEHTTLEIKSLMLYRLSWAGIEFCHFEEGKYDIRVN